MYKLISAHADDLCVITLTESRIWLLGKRVIMAREAKIQDEQVYSIEFWDNHGCQWGQATLSDAERQQLEENTWVLLPRELPDWRGISARCTTLVATQESCRWEAIEKHSQRELASHDLALSQLRELITDRHPFPTLGKLERQEEP